MSQKILYKKINPPHCNSYKRCDPYRTLGSNLKSYKNLAKKHLNQFEYQTKRPIILEAK